MGNFSVPGKLSSEECFMRSTSMGGPLRSRVVARRLGCRQRGYLDSAGSTVDSGRRPYSTKYTVSIPSPLSGTPHTVFRSHFEVSLRLRSRPGIKRERHPARDPRTKTAQAAAATRAAPTGASIGDRLLARERSFAIAEDEQSIATSDAETTVSTDTSTNATPLGSGTPMGTVIVPERDRSGTVVARRIWDVDVGDRSQEQPMPGPVMSQSHTIEEDADVEMETWMIQDQDADGSMPVPPSLSHLRRTVDIVSDSPSPTGAGTVGVGMAGASDTVYVDLDTHIIINTNTVDDGVFDGIVALDENVNDGLAMGAPPGAPGAIDGAHMREHLTPNTRNMVCEHHHYHGHAHGREGLTPHTVLASSSMHVLAHPPILVAMPVAADGANACPARTSPARADRTSGLPFKRALA
ncbi:hypothetical protein DFH11DRAFT_1794287 [Phellopilus nigrolimitatus]|nr:hypothetical protein DFH11DRAFT_1794287 [Phellopilus nigrolimitatus]